MTDLVLAIFHHLFVFSLVAILAAEFALVRPGLSGRSLRSVTLLDAHYGAIAILIIAIGVGRVEYGLKGPDYYHANPWFWCKMAAFAAIGLLSIVPTLSFLKWRRAAKADPLFSPAQDRVIYVRRWIGAELALLPIVLICAAVMARFSGF